MLSMTHVDLLLKILKLQKWYALKTLETITSSICWILFHLLFQKLTPFFIYLHQILSEGEFFTIYVYFWKCNCIRMLFHKLFQLIVADELQ